jgi:PadR family transcriptional regulator AphA
MIGKVRESVSGKYIETIQGEFIIEKEEDALDLLSLCGEHEISCLLIHYENLSAGFFDLRTGLAGSVLQKFVLYRLKTAAIIPPEKIEGRFGEMVREANRGNQFRVFNTSAEAVAWLQRTRN